MIQSISNPDPGVRHGIGAGVQMATQWLVLLLVGLWILMPDDGWSAEIAICKYSVRDVAFVNVHGKSWLLQLRKPKQVDPATMSDWNELLREKLKRSNVGFQWVDPKPAEASDPAGDSSDRRLPSMSILSDDLAPIPVEIEPGQSFGEVLDALLESAARDQILDHVVDSLCVFVLVETGVEAVDSRARAACAEAVEQVERQMWTLEKPTENGPALVVISRDEWASERWLLQSLGISLTKQPTVAIVYGQGRRLGELLVGEQIDVQKLVGRASICGTDCECDLDPRWLYGSQLIHNWSPKNERSAESGLSFDPKSAFVVAEVAQIVQKNLRRGVGQESTGARVDLGGGLIIHDLEPDPEPMSSELPGTPPNELESSASINDQSESLQPNVQRLPATGADTVSENEQEGSGLFLPWPLLIGLTVAVLLVFLFRSKR